jgi:hypothetical protein
MGAKRGWNWHAWSKKNGIRKYMGFFETEESALLFKRNNPDREFITITNFGPTDLAKQSTVTAARTTTTARARIPETREQMRQREQMRKQREEAQAAARAEADRKYREQQQANREKQEAARKRREQDAKDMAGIRKDAAAGLEKHKADEAADLKAGINR